MPQKHLNRLKEILRGQGRTNKWLAQKLGKTEVTISRWCHNNQQPDLETLFRIGKLLGVPAREIVAEEEE
ncbi:MAG: helix-turn-helix transcriptional regulator [Bacteroidota bacterium]